MRARTMRQLLLAAPLTLVPLQALDRDGPFSFTVRAQVKAEKSLVQQLFSGTGPGRSPLSDAPSPIHR